MSFGNSRLLSSGYTASYLIFHTSLSTTLRIVVSLREAIVSYLSLRTLPPTVPGLGLGRVGSMEPGRRNDRVKENRRIRNGGENPMEERTRELTEDEKTSRGLGGK